MRIAGALLIAALLAAPTPGAAEMSSDEYESGGRRLTPAQRAQEAERVRQERERAEALEREREAQAEQQRRDEQARLAARPLGVRLVEARCGACHGPEFLRDHRYGRLGWWSVLLRMEYVNGAHFEAGDRGVIVDHLVASRPASGARLALEWVVAAAAPLLAIGVGWRLLRRAR
jgi:mono/diheme cytochrome c family protein